MTGEKNELMAAGDTILAKIKEDPQSGCCPNLSYAGFAGPVANANPTGREFIHPLYSIYSILTVLAVFV